MTECCFVLCSGPVLFSTSTVAGRCVFLSGVWTCGERGQIAFSEGGGVGGLLPGIAWEVDQSQVGGRKTLGLGGSGE